MEKSVWAGVCGLKQGDSDVGAVGQGLVENSDTERQPYTSYHYVAPEEHLLDKPVGRHDPDLAACDQQVQLQLAGEGGGLQQGGTGGLGHRSGPCKGQRSSCYLSAKVCLPD